MAKIDSLKHPDLMEIGSESILGQVRTFLTDYFTGLPEGKKTSLAELGIYGE